MVDIQLTGIRAPLDVLDVAPPNTNLPRLDERTLSWVYPVAGEFMVQRPFAWSVTGGAQSINATQVRIQDTGLGSAAVTFAFGTAFQIASVGRQYVSVTSILAGATVTPITMGIAWRFIDAAGNPQAFLINQWSQVNPSTRLINSIYVPPGVILDVFNVDNGGAGDTLNVGAIGFAHEAGTPVVQPSASLVSV